MHKSTIYTLLAGIALCCLPFFTQAQAIPFFTPDLLAYATPNDINDMSKSSPLWPFAALAVVGLGFIMIFQYKHRKKS
jgi:hypothetical protein